MFETWCNFSATKIGSSCRDKNRLCKRALKPRGIIIKKLLLVSKPYEKQNDVRDGEVTDMKCRCRRAKFKAIMKGTYRLNILPLGTGGSFENRDKQESN